MVLRLLLGRCRAVVDLGVASNDEPKHGACLRRRVTEEGSRGAAEDRSDRPPLLLLLESLDVYRHAKVGAVIGIAIAAVAYLFRVLELLGPSAGTRTFPVFGAGEWYLLLAFVLAATSALLVTIVLTVKTAVREMRTLD